MLADTQLFFMWMAFSLVIYWIFPPEKPVFRQLWLIVISFVFIFSQAPVAALQVTWMSVMAILGVWAIQKFHHALILWLFIFLALLPLLWHRTIQLDAGLIITLGVTFATLRAISIIIDSYAGTSKQSVLSNLAYMFFLPLYTVGPVDKASKFSQEGLATQFNVKDFFRGFTRTCLGIFKNIVIADQFIKAHIHETFPVSGRDFTQYSASETFVFIILSFLYTYINFSAFVDVAVGISKMFGIRIVENFNFPIFAKNLQDFWKRWHISLGNWITNYLYMPIVFLIGKRWAPYVATFLAFSLIGWWHDSNLNYIAWGVLHGAGQCLVQFWVKSIRGTSLAKTLNNSALYVVASWGLTMLFVAWVQTVANLKSVDSAILMTKSLIGLN